MAEETGPHSVSLWKSNTIKTLARSNASKSLKTSASWSPRKTHSNDFGSSSESVTLLQALQQRTRKDQRTLQEPRVSQPWGRYKPSSQMTVPKAKCQAQPKTHPCPDTSMPASPFTSQARRKFDNTVHNCPPFLCIHSFHVSHN